MEKCFANKISNEINRFFKNLLGKTLQMSLPQVNNFFENIIFPVLTQEQKQDCEKEISEKVIDALKSFINNKSPGNDSLTKEFYEAFWSELKEPFMNSISQTKISKKLITSQRQAVIKLIEKKDKDKRFIKNWRPISLLNVDYKIISKVFSARLKKVLPLLISSQQTAYVANRCISESGRLISDLLDVTEKFKTKGYPVTLISK